MRKIKDDKLAEAFMKFMTNNGATFIDVTPERKKKKMKVKNNYLPKPPRKPAK